MTRVKHPVTGQFTKYEDLNKELQALVDRSLRLEAEQQDSNQTRIPSNQQLQKDAATMGTPWENMLNNNAGFQPIQNSQQQPAQTQQGQQLPAQTQPTSKIEQLLTEIVTTVKNNTSKIDAMVSGNKVSSVRDQLTKINPTLAKKYESIDDPAILLAVLDTAKQFRDPDLTNVPDGDSKPNDSTPSEDKAAGEKQFPSRLDPISGKLA